MYTRAKTVDVVEHKLNSSMSVANHWLNCNKIILNGYKTKFMLVSTIQKQHHLPKTVIDLSLDEITIECVTC